MGENILIIFGKFPRLGFVKTRLARSLGDDSALELFKTWINHAFDEADKVRTLCTPVYFFAEAEDEASVRLWLKDRFPLFAQSKENLVERNKDAFARMFAQGAKKVVIIATDVPDLSAEIFTQAFSSLDTSDVVLGLDNVDGYYLLGMKALHNELFTVTYGSNPIGPQLLTKAQELGLSVAQLPMLFNINTIEDLKEWQDKKEQ